MVPPLNGPVRLRIHPNPGTKSLNARPYEPLSAQTSLEEYQGYHHVTIV